MEVSGQLHAPAALPQGKSPWYPLDRRWVDPRAVVDAVVKRKIPSPRRESNSRTPIIQRYTEWAVTAWGSSFYLKQTSSNTQKYV
jgi:hypothetical protein